MCRKYVKFADLIEMAAFLSFAFDPFLHDFEAFFGFAQRKRAKRKKKKQHIKALLRPFAHND